MKYDAGLIKECCAATASLTGDIAEIGVWRGDSAECILDNSGGCHVWLYDTFTGMPPITIRGLDYHTAGAFGDTSLVLVQGKLARFGDRVIYRPGVFPTSAAADRAPLRFVHIDCDLYLSTKAAIEWSCQRLVDGGVILSDDYGCSSAAGAAKAFNEWVEQHKQWQLVKRNYRAVMSRQPAEAIA